MCEQHLVTCLHDTQLARGQWRTLLCRVTPVSTSSSSTSFLPTHLGLFPALSSLADLDRLCKVLRGDDDEGGYCTIALKIKQEKDGEDDKTLSLKAGTVLALGQGMRVEEEEDEEEDEEEQQTFKVKLVKDLEVPANGGSVRALLVPWGSRTVSHCPALIELDDPRLRLASKGVPYFQSGKMTSVDVAAATTPGDNSERSRSGRRRRKKHLIKLEKGKVRRHLSNNKLRRLVLKLTGSHMSKQPVLFYTYVMKHSTVPGDFYVDMYLHYISTYVTN